MDDEARFNEAAREIERRNPSTRWQGMHLIWTHPTSGGQLWLGNDTAAQDLAGLQRSCITHIVNCTRELPNYHEQNTGLSYFRFVISDSWQCRTIEATRALFDPPLSWMHTALSQGRHVLSHCLAGAHRSAMNIALYLYRYWMRENVSSIYSIITSRREVADPSLYSDAMKKLMSWVDDKDEGVPLVKDPHPVKLLTY